MLVSHPRSWLARFVDRSQVLALRITGGQPSAWLAGFPALLADIPDNLPMREQVVVQKVTAQIVGRMLRDARVREEPHVYQSGLALVTSVPYSESWRGDLAQFTRAYELALHPQHDGFARGVCDPIDTWVRRAVRFIEEHYTDPSLALSDVATELNLSSCHIARVLKVRTGQGFVTHLRGCRIAAAKHLLKQSSLSLKEIASAVGYKQPSRLSHDFRQCCRVTPIDFRRSARSEA
jgi:AraC-like DNA-binding protein